MAEKAELPESVDAADAVEAGHARCLDVLSMSRLPLFLRHVSPRVDPVRHQVYHLTNLT